MAAWGLVGSSAARKRMGDGHRSLPPRPGEPSASTGRNVGASAKPRAAPTTSASKAKVSRYRWRWVDLTMREITTYPSTDVAIIGGGVIGLFAAYYLRIKNANCRVTVIER